ncbi:MAG: DegT/DnrJ/EryC1/StrS family aminotransferase [Duncaniella sp.]|nr:DegT/DnrJ/EryC1/StrS family aminotransferase [Duncaniella sp.]
MTLKYPFLDLGKVNEPYLELLSEAAERVIRSGRYIGGPEIEEFEARLREELEVEHAIGVSNGLDGLRLIFHALIELGRLKRGDEVIVPANTYIASVLAVTDAGLTPVLVDVDERTMNIDENRMREAITEQTRAVLLVHLYGRVAWNEAISNLIQENNLTVIEDCAQSIGARSVYEGLNGTFKSGSLGLAAAFSFYPTKNVGALGDAGAVTTNDHVLAKAIRALANYGCDRRYHNIYCGYNCRLDPLQAALLNVKLKHIDQENADRFARAVTYSRNIVHPDVITPIMSDAVTDNVWHQYVIRVINGNRDRMQAELLARGVGTDIHYPLPAHLQPCYSALKHAPLPITEMLSTEILSLPIGTGTSVKDAAEISEIINSIAL